MKMTLSRLLTALRRGYGVPVVRAVPRVTRRESLTCLLLAMDTQDQSENVKAGDGIVTICSCLGIGITKLDGYKDVGLLRLS
jgi:hypothetical protein